MAYSGINIKPSRVGSLHKLLGVAQKKKIPSADLAVSPGDSAAVKKKKVFAKNARSWNHSGRSFNKLMGN